MILYINTAPNDFIEIGVKHKNKFVIKKSIKSRRQQAEKLLPAIAKLLKASRLDPAGLKEIQVVNQGGSFTSLRIGVVTANALGYSLGLPVSGVSGKAKTIGRGKLSFKVVSPQYAGRPDIIKKKQLV